MKIENLKGLNEVRNYKELCEILEMKVAAGNTKKSQIKELERYCKYNKEGNKFIIEEIYDEPLERIDGRIENNKLGNNAIYYEDIEKLILYILSKQKDDVKVVNFSTNQLLLAINMINNNYKEGRKCVGIVSDLLEVPSDMIYEFYNTSSSELKRKIERSLNKMQRMYLIKWSKSINIHKTKIELPKNELGEFMIDSKGKVIMNKIIEHREATDKEKTIILKSEREVIKEMGLENSRDVFIRGKWNEFKKNVEIRLKEKHIFIDYYYDTYKILFNNEHVVEECEKYEIKDSMISLNDKVSKSLKEGYVRKHNNALDKYNSTDTFYFDKVRIKDEYVETLHNLVDSLIGYNAKDITKDIKLIINN